MFGPRLVRLPQSMILVESVAHHNRYAVLPAPPPPSLLLMLVRAVPEYGPVGLSPGIQPLDTGPTTPPLMEA